MQIIRSCIPSSIQRNKKKFKRLNPCSELTYIVVLDGENDESVGIYRQEWLWSQFTTFFPQFVLRLGDGGNGIRGHGRWGHRISFGNAGFVIRQDGGVGIPFLFGCYKGERAGLVGNHVLCGEGVEFLFES